MLKEISIEYSHIYTNNHIGEEHELSLSVLREVVKGIERENISLVVMVDDYSFPDPSFDYESFTAWLNEQSFEPDLVLRESQLIPYCDETLKLISDEKLKEQISDYVRSKRYPCSLFVATWYLIRLGYIKSQIFNESLVSQKLINILPSSFKPFEEKAFEIIRTTKFSFALDQIKNEYFEGRLIA